MTGLSVVSLIVSIVALVLGWTAFNRTGTDVEQVVQDRVDAAVETMESQYQELENRMDAELRDADEPGDDASGAGTTTPEVE